MQGVSDPEQKRKAIGKEFIENFKDFANSLVEKGLPKPRFLVQGTLYPDVIESCPPPGSGQKHSHTIKSHHNVGGLPKDLQFTLIEPLKELFKVHTATSAFTQGDGAALQQRLRSTDSSECILLYPVQRTLSCTEILSPEGPEDTVPLKRPTELARTYPPTWRFPCIGYVLFI